MKKILVILLLTTVFLGCKKKPTEEPIDPNAMPAATQTGANILACKVNGKTHIYSGVPITLAQNGVSFTKYNGPNGKEQYIEITGSNNKNEGNIKLYLYSKDWDIEINKEYQFSNEKKVGGEYYLIADNNTYYSNTNNDNGHVIFTKYDNIIAGKFSFTAHNNTYDSVGITEGFFDINVSQE